MKRLLWTSIVILAPSACDDKAQTPERDVDSLLASVSTSRIRADMNALAADEMEGREAATAGHQKAVDYVARRFSDLELEPFGDDGTFLQNIEFLKSRIEPGSTSMLLKRGGIELSFDEGQDFVSFGGYGDATDLVTAPLVFVGYGIQAPEYSHDDFLDADLDGKILVVLSGAPPDFSTDERAFYSSSSDKRALAEQLGAIGILTILSPADQERLPWKRVTATANGSGMRWLGPDGVPHDGSPQLVGNAILSETGARNLFDFADQNLDVVMKRHVDGQTGSFELGVSATLQRRSELRKVSSPNVIALLRGSDPEFAKDYLLVTAHLDHLGVRMHEQVEEIYNGAYDNAVGVAIMLSIAQALSEAKSLPRRSVIFAAVTAEEKGLRGSDYLANNPPVPISSIVANINIDMPFLGFPVSEVQGLGADHSTLGNTLNRVAASLGIAATPDPRPELVRLIRSDQFSFVKQGIPGMNLKPGARSSSPNFDGASLLDSYLQNNYHNTSDDSSLPFNDEGASLFASVAVLLSSSVANAEERPKWNDGDFFGDRFRKDHAGEEK